MGQYRFHLIVGTVLFNILQDPGDFFFKAGDFCQIFTPEICIGAYGMYQIFCGIFFVCIIKFQYGSVVRDGIGISFGTNCLKSGLCQLCAPVELDIEGKGSCDAGREFMEFFNISFQRRQYPGSPFGSGILSIWKWNSGRWTGGHDQ